MTPGQNYRLIFQVPDARLPREAVLRFLDADGNRYRFDARPEAGTQTIERANITYMRETNDPILLPRPYRGGTP